jgi:DNA topoisomerase-1
MAKNLVIVESPAKAKTIEGYLGSDYTVKSSYGHVRDLSAKGISIEIDNGFTPIYEISEDKTKVVAELKKLSKAADMVWLASDEDREGEAIAWHLSESLELPAKKTKRIVFNEITKTAITKAIQNPRDINYDLVNAQQARRILDRLVGYELSPVLWKKIRPSLSAGRVQSVAVRLIVDRERERNKFKTESFFKVNGLFTTTKATRAFKAELNQKFKTPAEAEKFLNGCTSFSFKVNNTETKPATKSPTAPFTTSTLQQEANRKLGFSVARTMQVAQKLYEAGKITYMRTDSVNMSDFALQASEQAIYSMFGKDFHQKRNYTTKSKGAQEAHECIRPTDFNVQTAGEDASAEKLYDLIWKRSIASQMSDAKLEKTNIYINSPQAELQFIARGEVIKFEGFLKVYLESSDEDEENENDQTLPPVVAGDNLGYKEIIATERFTQPPSRYSEASLVKKLEELGIGRPSTYAPTISTIQKRQYVVKEEREGTPRNYQVYSVANGKVSKEQRTENTGAEKNKLFPTDIGSLVNDFLVDNFPKILDFHFTATVEKEFDEIANGKVQWKDMIKEFYDPFHENIVTTEKEAKRATGKRLLGVDPASKKNMYALIGRFGPMIQIGEIEDEEKPKYASVRGKLSIESITLEEALELFKLPKPVGTFEEKEMVVGIGRFGPYVRHDNKFVSIPKGTDPMEVDEAKAIELIQAKRVADANRLIQSFDDDIKVLKGRWGAYIAQGKENYKIPKGEEPEALTLMRIKEIIAEQDAKFPKKKAGGAKSKTKEPKAKAKKKGKGGKSSKAMEPEPVFKKAASAKKTKAVKSTVKKTTAKTKASKPVKKKSVPVAKKTAAAKPVKKVAPAKKKPVKKTAKPVKKAAKSKKR